MNKEFIVRVSDSSFVIREHFASFEEALAYADKMGESFGSWNVDLYEI